MLTIVNDPVALPATVGANSTVTVAVCPGESVAGNELLEIRKPVPDSDAEFTVTAVVPVEVKVKSCVEVEPRRTSPNATAELFKLSCAAAAFNVKAAVAEPPFAVAVSVVVVVEATADAVAVKLVEVDPAATVTVDGTVTAALSLTRLTLVPPLDAVAESATVQVVVAAPVNVLGEQLSDAGVGDALAAVAVPLNPTTVALVSATLVETVIVPVELPTVVGANSTANM